MAGILCIRHFSIKVFHQFFLNTSNIYSQPLPMKCKAMIGSTTSQSPSYETAEVMEQLFSDTLLRLWRFGADTPYYGTDEFRDVRRDTYTYKHTCMYVCMYVHTHMHIYTVKVAIYIYNYVSIDRKMYIDTYFSICIYTHAHSNAIHIHIRDNIEHALNTIALCSYECLAMF